jgi:hypothetical protein
MKKLFLSVLFLMLSAVSFSQTFVKKYTSFICEEADVLGEWKETTLTVVFNEAETGDIVFYYDNGVVKRFLQIGSVNTDKNKANEGYQIIMCVDSDNGRTVAIQLFDEDDTLRAIVDKGYYIEFHK